MDARKDTYGEKRAMELLKTVNEVYASKGKKVVHFNLKKEKPAAADLKKLILGPTGNLRAPTLRVGKKLIVGFNEETYEELLG